MATLTVSESLTNEVETSTNILLITELTGLERTVTLGRASLPFKGANWGMDMKAPIRFAPGSIEGTQQVLGPRPTPTSFTGMWRRTKLGGHPILLEQDGAEYRIIYPETAKALFEDILIRGSMLRVSWESTTRYGRLTHLDFPVQTKHDIGWDATFDWVSYGAQFPERVVRTRNGGDTANIEGLLLDTDSLGQLDAVTIATNDRAPRPNGAPELTIGQVNALFDSPNKLMQGFSRNVRELAGKIKAVADLATTLKNQPALVTNTALATAENIVSQCNQFQDEIGRNPFENNGYDHRVSSLLNSYRYYNAGNGLAESLKGKAQDMRDAQSKKAMNEQAMTAQSDIVALHAVKVGDSLMGISVRYYKSPDYGAVIANANGISYPSGVAAQDGGKPSIGGKTLLVIPVLRK